jgi:hypothetical protein
MQHVLIVPCSRRKRGHDAKALRASDLPYGRMDVVAEEWARRVRDAPLEILASEYYAGRGPVEAKAAAAESGAVLVFVSAGLGLVRASAVIPRYSLTTVPGDPHAVGPHVDGDFSPVAWWEALREAALRKPNELKLVCSDAGGALVVALPGTYLRMVGTELASLPSALLSRMRIVGAPLDSVPSTLRALWMPYDDRLDGALSANPGTRGDFPQRAARHFFQYVLQQDPDGDASDHADSVKRHLRTLSRPIRLTRRTGSDTELVRVISALLPRTAGRSGQTLMLLRREAGWACEQGRFRRLFAVAATQWSLS